MCSYSNAGYRSHDHQMKLINQQVQGLDRYYDHDIFIEPTLARSLHQRDISSSVKSLPENIINNQPLQTTKTVLSSHSQRAVMSTNGQNNVALSSLQNKAASLSPQQTIQKSTIPSQQISGPISSQIIPNWQMTREIPSPSHSSKQTTESTLSIGNSFQQTNGRVHTKPLCLSLPRTSKKITWLARTLTPTSSPSLSSGQVTGLARTLTPTSSPSPSSGQVTGLARTLTPTSASSPSLGQTNTGRPSISEDPPSSPLTPPYSPLIPTQMCDTIDIPLNQDVSSTQLHHSIRLLLPQNCKYRFEQFTQHNGQELSFNTKFNINIKTESDALQWLSEFENCSGTTFRITKGTTTKGKRLLYKTCRHCQHKRKSSNKPKKQDRCTNITQRDKKTGCSTKLVLRVHRITKSTSHIKRCYPCQVDLTWQHNHSINSAHALSFKPINEETKEKFFHYFSEGHSPSSARHHHTLCLTIQVCWSKH